MQAKKIRRGAQISYCTIFDKRPCETYMGVQRRAGKLVVILHADVAGSTSLVHQDEHLAHERIHATFRRFSDTITRFHGRVRELRGDALLVEFERASDAAAAALVFQAEQAEQNARLDDVIRPTVRVGIALGEVVVADRTVTGAGVVLAQRMEQLAPPGGVCTTGAIQEALPQRMPFEGESLGEHEVKGFDKPVHVYTVRLKEGAALPEPGAAGVLRSRRAVAAAAVAVVCLLGVLAWYRPWAPEFEPVSPDAMAHPLPDKPSIAVLPFDNMSDDPQQEYFVDGMTEDLITDLSKLSELFVIARNSVFAYKDQAADVRQVARELGVRYVLEGSVRRVDDQVRINAQLVDATTGGHLWAERYDREIKDILSLQDEITGRIIASLALELTPSEKTDIERPETNNVAAYDAFLQGWEHLQRHTANEFAKALPYLERAVALDADYGKAHAALAWLYYQARQRSWHESLGLSEQADAMDQANRYLKLAMKHPTPLAHRVAADKLWQMENQYDEAVAEAKRAIALDPGDPVSHAGLARALIHAGRPEEAIAAIKRAMRLDPHYPPYYLFVLGLANFTTGQLEEAIVNFERALERNPEYVFPTLPLAAAHAHLGHKKEAQAALAKFGEVLGNPRIEYLESYWPFKRTVDANRFFDGLRKAGVPE